MPHFRTPLYLEKKPPFFSHKHSFFSIGSCFASEMAERLAQLKFSIHHNPFGILFHPLAIENALMRIYSLTEYQISEIFKHEELYLSWDHHSSFNETSAEKIVYRINKQLNQANEFLQKTNFVIITLGTAFVYKLIQHDLIVANCHKIPAQHFNKQLLTEHQIRVSLKNMVEMIQDIAQPDVRIIFTLSPVRHLKEGMIENNLSKARLLCAIHEVVNAYESCNYFPAYEFVMDDLRDYRFYKSDLIHPNEQALEYIWDAFKNNYIEENTIEIIKKVQKIQQSLQHTPQNKNTLAYKQFLYGVLKNIQEIQAVLPTSSFDKEITQIKNQLQNAY